MRKWLRHSLLVAAGGLSLTGLKPAIAAEWSEQDQLDGQCVAVYAADLGKSDSENPDPGLMALVGTRNEQLGTRFPHHHPQFNIDEDALPRGAALHVLYALQTLASVEPA